MQALHYLSQQPVDSRAGSPGIYSASSSYGVGRRRIHEIVSSSA